MNHAIKNRLKQYDLHAICWHFLLLFLLLFSLNGNVRLRFVAIFYFISIERLLWCVLISTWMSIDSLALSVDCIKNQLIFIYTLFWYFTFRIWLARLFDLFVNAMRSYAWLCEMKIGKLISIQTKKQPKNDCDLSTIGHFIIFATSIFDHQQRTKQKLDWQHLTITNTDSIKEFTFILALINE